MTVIKTRGDNMYNTKMIIEVTEAQKKELTKEFIKDTLMRLNQICPQYNDEQEFIETEKHYQFVLKDLTTQEEYDNFMAELEQ